MVGYSPAKFGGHRHCGSGDMFSVAEGQDSIYPRLNPPLLLISEAHDMPCSHTQNFRTQTQ